MSELSKPQKALIAHIANGYRETGKPVKTVLSTFKGFHEKTVARLVKDGLIASVKVTGDEYTFAGVAQRNGVCHLELTPKGEAYI